jgi:hypothetical protein
VPSISNEKVSWEECTAKEIRITREEERSRETPGVLVETSTDTAGAPVNIAINIANLVITPTITPSDLESIISPDDFFGSEKV